MEMLKVTPKKRRKSSAGEWQDAFLATLRNSGNVRVSCEKAGIARKTAYQWKKKSKTFAKKWEDALEDAVDMLEDIAMERAKKSSDVLLIFLLKAHRPEKYKDRYEHTSLERNIRDVKIHVVYDKNQRSLSREKDKEFP